MSSQIHAQRVKRGFSVGVKNWVASVLIHSVRWMRASPQRSPRAVLLVATTGLGDSLMMTPGIRALRHAYPDVQIDLLVTRSSRVVFENNQHVKRLWLLGSGLSALLQIQRAMCSQYQVAYVLHASSRLAWILAALSAPKVVAGDWQSASVPSDWVTDWYRTPHREHRIRSHLKMLRVGHPQVNLDDVAMEFNASQLQIENACSRYPQLMNDENRAYVGMFPGAKDRFKCWPLRRFIEVAHWLRSHQVHVVLFGGPEDEDLVQDFYAACPETIVVTGSVELVAVTMSRLSLLITNDSGPMHLAGAMHVPVISLFAPTDSQETGLLDEQSSGMILQKPVTCFPSKEFPIIKTQCFNKACKDPICLHQISVIEVLAMVKTHLELDEVL